MIQVEEPARRRGNIRPRGSSLQVRLFAGKDPVTGRDVYLTASIPGTDKKARKKAEDKLAEFRTQVTKQRSTPSSMKLDYAIHEWMRTSEHEDSTREGYLGYITRTIRPTLGDVPITKITARMTGELLHRVAALPDAVRRAAVHRAQGGRGARLHDGEVRAACVQADGCLNRPSDPLDSQRHVGCCCAGDWISTKSYGGRQAAQAEATAARSTVTGGGGPVGGSGVRDGRRLGDAGLVGDDHGHPAWQGMRIAVVARRS